MNINEIKIVFFMAVTVFFVTLTTHHNSKLHRLESKRVSAKDSISLDSTKIK